MAIENAKNKAGEKMENAKNRAGESYEGIKNRAAETYETVKNRAAETYESVKNRATETVEDVTEGSRDLVGHYPISSTLVAFGRGVGVGLTVACLLSDSMFRERSYSQRMGKQMLDYMSNLVPSNLTNYMRS